MAARVPGIPETAISMREVMKGRRQGSTGWTQLRLTEGPVWKLPGQGSPQWGSAHCDLEFAVDVRQCPLRSGSLGKAREGEGGGEGKGKGRGRKEEGRRKEAYNFYKIQRPWCGGKNPRKVPASFRDAIGKTMPLRGIEALLWILIDDIAG